MLSRPRGRLQLPAPNPPSRQTVRTARAMAPAVPNNLQKERRILSLQPGSAAGAAAAAAVAAEQPAAAGAERHGDKKAAFTLRRYRPSDHPQVVEICHNVYGGTDILPDRIIHDAARPDTHVLVAALPHDDSVAALLCCQQRGDVLWLYGARTREDMRRRGLAELLLVRGHAHMPPGWESASGNAPGNASVARLPAIYVCLHSKQVSWCKAASTSRNDLALPCRPRQKPWPAPYRVWLRCCRSRCQPTAPCAAFLRGAASASCARS